MADGKLIKRLDLGDISVVSVGSYLGCSDLFFMLLSDGTVRCYVGSSLDERKALDCSLVTAGNLTITAMSSQSFSDENEYLILTYREKSMLRIY